MFFPTILTKYQILSRTDIKRTRSIINNCYLIQLISGVLLYLPLVFTVGGIAWSVATFWPIPRIPVFIMGVLGGLLRLNPSCHLKYDRAQLLPRALDILQSQLLGINPNFWILIDYDDSIQKTK